MNNKTWISASELAEYWYCHRAWWWRRSGLRVETTPQMVRGTTQHDEMQSQVKSSQSSWWLGLFLTGVGLLLLVVYYLGWWQ